MTGGNNPGYAASMNKKTLKIRQLFNINEFIKYVESLCTVDLLDSI